MNEFDILKAVGDVDNAYIDEALAARPVKKRARSFLVAAAVCAAAALIGFFVLKSFIKPGDNMHGTHAFSHTREPKPFETQNTEPWYNAEPPTPEFVYNGRTYRQSFGLPEGISLDSEIVGEFVAHIDYTYTFGEYDQSLQTITCHGSVKGDAYRIAGLDEKYALIVVEDSLYGRLDIYINSDSYNNSPVPELVVENIHKLSDKIDSIRYEYALEHEYPWLSTHDHEFVLEGIRDENGVFIPEIKRFIEAVANGEVVRLSAGQGCDEDDLAIHFEYLEFTNISNQLVHLKVDLTNGISAHINVLRGGYLEFDSPLFGASFIKADESELMPFLEWIFGGKCDEENRFALLPMDQVHERLREVERFGSFVPKVIPEGCKVRYAYIDYYSRYEENTGNIKNLKICYTAHESESWISLRIGDAKDLRDSDGKIVLYDGSVRENKIDSSEFSLEKLRSFSDNHGLSLLIICGDTILHVSANRDYVDDVYTLLSSAIW